MGKFQGQAVAKAVAPELLASGDDGAAGKDGDVPMAPADDSKKKQKIMVRELPKDS